MNHRTPTRRRRPRPGATRAEALAVLASITILLGALAPVLAQVGHELHVVPSGVNLRLLHEAMACYAADWNDRQFTAVPDDLGVAGGSCRNYADQFGCHPSLFAGFDCDGLLWGYWGDCPGYAGSGCQGNALMMRPFNFDFPVAGFGIFRMPQVKPLHDYLDGRFYSPNYYAYADRKAWEAARPAFGQDCEFVPDVGTIPSSYALSPAAMLGVDVLRAPSAGGFQHPDTFDEGYASPAVSQALYPELKTWMIEHSWLRNAPGPCHPDFVDPFGAYSEECDPYLFNHGADAAPLTLFFDGSVEPLRTGDVAADDAQVMQQTGGDGLWSRDTPLGETGYYGEFSFDGTLASHHVLTTGGIRGRDRLAAPAAAATTRRGGVR